MRKTAFTNVALYQQAAFQFGPGFYVKGYSEYFGDVLDPRGWWPPVRTVLDSRGRTP